MRKTHCKHCRKEVDEGTRSNSIQEFGFVVCSMECGIKETQLENAGE
jgi:hypothetical protein